MQGRKLDARWTLVLPVIALAAVVLVFLSRGATPQTHHVTAIAHPVRVSEPLGSREFRGPAASPTATLLQSLQAADILVKAGKLAPPPTLAQSWEAGAALVRAGVIAGPVASVGETWLAIDQLIKAGVLPTPPWAADAPPTLQQSLEAADILVKAGKIAAPAPLHAQSAPPEAPPPPPPSATPVPATVAPPPPTNTPVPHTTAAATNVGAAASSGGGWYDDAYTAQVFAGVNQRRTAAGLPALTLEPHLAASAAAYAKLLTDTNTFSHTGPDGSTLVTRDEAAGFPFTVQIGEVLAWGSNGWTAPEIVQAWMDSPAHHEQIMSPVYTRAGAGCYFSKSTGTLMVRCSMELAG